MYKNRIQKQKNVPSAKQTKFLAWLTSTWGIIISACTLIGIGIGVGAYFQQLRDDIEKSKEFMQIHLQQEQTNKLYDTQIYELRQQIYQLESENLKLKGDSQNEYRSK